MTTIKRHWNSVLSDEGAKCASANAGNNMYLLEPSLPNQQYARFKLNEIPMAIRTEYGLDAMEHNRCVYARIHKTWYGLKEARKIANDDMVEIIERHGYLIFIYKN